MMQVTTLGIFTLLAPGAAVLGALMRAWAIRGKWDTTNRWAGVRAFAVLFGLLWLVGLMLLLAVIHFGLLLGLVVSWLGLNTLLGPVFALVAAPRSSHAALPAPGSGLPVPVAGSVPASVGIPEEIADALTLGTALHGDLWEWVKEECVIYPRWALGLHGIVIGRSGAGKTETLLRIAYLAAKIYGMQVVYLDAKGDWDLAARFRLLMQKAGIPDNRIGMFPNQAHNAWLGDEHDILNKLLQSQQWTETFYREVAVNLLDLAIHAPGGPPRNSADLLNRLNPNRLAAIYKGKPQEQELKGLDADKQWGAYLRYSAFFRAVRGKLDGSVAFGSFDASYYLLDGVRLKDEAGRLGQFLIEDFEQYLAQRRYSAGNSDRRTLIIIDDYSSISAAASAVGMFERIRGLRGCVLISAQSEEGLGLYSDARRIMGTAPTLILHASTLPKDTIEAGGKVLMPQYTIHLPSEAVLSMQQEEPSISLTLRLDYRVQPSDVQQLPTGRAYIVHGGKAQLADIEMLPYEADEMEKLAADLQHDAAVSLQSLPPKQKKQPGQRSTSSPGSLPRLDDLTND